MNTRFSAFIAASCLLHAGLLWQAQHADAPALDIGGEARALRVTLAAGAPGATAAGELASLEAPAQARATRPAHHPPVAARKPAAPDPAQAGRASPPPTRQPANKAAPPPAQTRLTADKQPQAGTPPSSPNVSERVSAALQRQLSEAFDYPWLARKRGWQGLVTLSLHVAEDGALSHWKVVHTSGYSLLDRSALQAAQRIGRLRQAEQLLNGRSLNLSIPVRYQLLDG